MGALHPARLLFAVQPRSVASVADVERAAFLRFRGGAILDRTGPWAFRRGMELREQQSYLQQWSQHDVHVGTRHLHQPHSLIQHGTGDYFVKFPMSQNEIDSSSTACYKCNSSSGWKKVESCG